MNTARHTHKTFIAKSESELEELIKKLNDSTSKTKHSCIGLSCTGGLDKGNHIVITYNRTMCEECKA